MLRYQLPEYIVPVSGKWIKMYDKQLCEMETSNRKQYIAWDDYISRIQRNPLAFFLAHGRPTKDGKSNSGLDMLNDQVHDLILLTAPNQVGKPQPLTTKIITPYGYKLLKDIMIGDMVIDMNGNIQFVQAVHEQGMLPTYRIEFDNGEVSTEAADSHLWYYLRHQRAFKDRDRRGNIVSYKTYNQWQIKSTEDIILEQGYRASPQKRGYIPICHPVHYNARNISHYIPSYTMGVLLGDGCMTSGTCSFASNDRQIVDLVAIEMSNKCTIKYHGKYHYSMTASNPKVVDKLGHYEKSDLRIELERLGLYGKDCFNKFIPDEYKYDSEQNRISLLRGLMDTDGCISAKMCRCEFCTVNKQLAEDVAWLVRSLGGKCKITSRTTKYSYKGKKKLGALSYRVIVKMPSINPFYISRKANRWYPITRRPDRLVCDINYIGEKQCRCITVTGNTHSYLCDDFIVTHNSFTGAAYTSLRCIPCDKNWPVFTQHGVKHIEFKGPSQVIVASYSWDEVNTVWNTYRKILPREMLGPYAPFWGHFKGENGRPKELRFHNATKRIRLECDTDFIFLSYVQSLTHWEGKQCDIAHLDEQCPEDKFDALTARQITRGGERGFTPICMTLTGHVIPERPDTGAAGWIKRKIIDAKITKGRRVGIYKIAIEDVPSVIMSDEKKRKAYIQWIEEPEKLHDEHKKREAEARYWGGWEVGGGVVLSEWNPDFHWIEPFDIWQYKPTLYRNIDHGQNPCACALFAVMPWGDSILFQEYYEYGKNIYDNARDIVAMCGNERRRAEAIGWENEPETYEERFVKMDFKASELDARSFAKKADGLYKTIGQLYNEAGCWVTPTSGKHNYGGRSKDEGVGVIPLLKELLAIRKDRQHIDYRLGRKRDPELAVYGGPALYVFNTCKNTRAEFESWIGGKDDIDDLISCAKCYAARPRPYLGDFYVDQIQQKQEVPRRSVTGY
jgi:hypothetical protein